jgi:tetratricopeptide (TPR) repeat protein
VRLDGDYERAGAAYEECLTLCREIGAKLRETLTYDMLAVVAQHQGDYDRAEAIILEGLNPARELGSGYQIAYSLALLAGPVGAKGQPERAARLLGASEAVFEAWRVGPVTADQLEIDQYMADVRAQLDEAAFEAAWAEGRAMSLEEAVAYALGENAE